MGAVSHRRLALRVVDVENEILANRPTIAILGGTGQLGPGLALRWARAGFKVIIGSRDPQRAAAVVTELAPQLDDGMADNLLRGTSNADAAEQCDIAVVTVPFDGMDSMEPLNRSLLAKTVVSTVVPMTFVDRRAAPLAVAEGSAAERLARLLPGAKVTAALQTVSAHDLRDLDCKLDADCLVAGDDDDAVLTTIELVSHLGDLRAVTVGALAQARLIEQITPLLLGLNRRHKATTGIRITGLTARP